MFRDLLLVCFIALLMLVGVQSYITPSRILVKPGQTSTSLFAHHPKMKIIRKIMHKRPKKHRPSDINRNNVNLGKSIEQVENAPPEYILTSSAESEKIKAIASNFWNNGDSSESWIEITPEDMVVTLRQNIEPLPAGGVRKTLPLVRSGTR